jgi:hypothetical protein
VSVDRRHRAADPTLAPVRHRRPLRFAALLLAATLFLLPGANGAPHLGAPGAAGAAPLAGPVAATLERGPVGGVSSSTFWGVVAQTSTRTGIATDRALGGFLNDTPITWFEYTQQTDQCNITSNTLYGNGGAALGGCGFDIASMKSWCSSRGPSCNTILLLPGENNNSGEDADMANYIVHTLHFQPSYFAIGNEPELWTHYGIPWGHWKLSDASTPTPLAYAVDVRAAIHAVRLVDAAAQFIGIEADCACGASWFADVAHVDGPLIGAIAYHTYPSATRKTLVTAGQFFSVLASSQNLTASYASVRADLAGQCSQCATIPVFVAEYNSGPGFAPSNLAGTWSDAVFLAASVVQAIRANVSMFSTFNLQNGGTTFGWSMLNVLNGLAPEGVLYEKVLSRLAMGTFRDVSIQTANGNVWAVVVGNQGARSLMVVNANATHAIDLDLNNALTVGPGSTPTTYQWSGAPLGPTDTRGALAGSYMIPAQGLLLIDFSN